MKLVHPHQDLYIHGPTMSTKKKKKLIGRMVMDTFRWQKILRVLQIVRRQCSISNFETAHRPRTYKPNPQRAKSDICSATAPPHRSNTKNKTRKIAPKNRDQALKKITKNIHHSICKKKNTEKKIN